MSRGHLPASVLYDRLTALAYFLETMHNRTGRDELIDFDAEVK
jgi:hypothetical protein